MTEDVTPAPEPTPAAAFAAGRLVRLPGTGHTVRLRKVGTRALLASGLVPNALADKVYRLIRPRDDAAPEPTEDERRRDLAERFEAFIWIAQQCLVAPRLVTGRSADYDAGEIAPPDLNDLDYLFLFYDWAEGSLDKVAPFLVAAHA